MDVFSSGGVWIYLTLTVACLGIPFGLAVVGLFGFMRWRLPFSVGWLALVLNLILGCVATIASVQALQTALVTVAEEGIRVKLTASGSALALSTMAFSEFCSALGFLLFAILGGLLALFGAGPGAAWDITAFKRWAAGLLLGAVCCALGLAVVADFPQLIGAASVVASMLLLGAICLFSVGAASARTTTESTSQRARIAGLRGFVFVSSLCAVLFWTAGCSRYYRMQGFELVAQVPPEFRAMLVEQANNTADFCSSLGVCFLLPVVFSGAMGLTNVLGRIDDRVLLGAGLGGAQLVVVGLFYALAANAIGGFL